MRKVIIRSVTLSNFRSFISEKVVFPLDAGLKFLGGNNEVEPRLGANGAGKSSLLDAICWAFYGVSVRGMKVSSLLAWGTKTAKVDVEVETLDEIHTITRSGPPMKIYFDGHVVDQQEIDKYLGLSHLRFLHSVIFGQDVSLFPDLTGPQRGEIFDEVLNLDIWNECLAATTDKVNALEKEVNKHKQEISYTQGSLASLPTEEYLKSKIKEWEEIHATDIENWELERMSDIQELEGKAGSWIADKKAAGQKLVDEIEAQEKEQDGIKSQLESIQKRFTDDYVAKEVALEHAVQDAQKVFHGLQSDLDHMIYDMEFWKLNNKCPTCGQVMNSSLKEHNILVLEDKIHTLKVEIKKDEDILETITKELQKIKKLVQDERVESSLAKARANTLMNDSVRVKSQIGKLTDQAEKLLDEINGNKNPFQLQIDLLKKKVNPHTSAVNPYKEEWKKVSKQRHDLDFKLNAAEEELKTTESKMTATEYWKHGFKRIRLYFVQKILAALQIEIESAISSLGLIGWGITLTTETENKSGTVKFGIQIHVKAPKAEGPWEGWSGGETQRLRLAIAMGMASLIQRAAGVSYVQEFWDEPTFNLSESGVEDLLESLKAKADMTRKGVFIIDHHSLNSSSFDEIFQVKKTDEGSKVVKIQ